MKRTTNSVSPKIQRPAHPPFDTFPRWENTQGERTRGRRVLAYIIIIYTSPLLAEQDRDLTNLTHALKQLVPNRPTKQDQQLNRIQLLTDYIDYLKKQGKKDPSAEALLKNLKSIQKPVKE